MTNVAKLEHHRHINASEHKIEFVIREYLKTLYHCAKSLILSSSSHSVDHAIKKFGQFCTPAPVKLLPQGLVHNGYSRLRAVGAPRQRTRIPPLTFIFRREFSVGANEFSWNGDECDANNQATEAVKRCGYRISVECAKKISHHGESGKKIRIKDTLPNIM